jgi:WD40 repeat protein
MPHQIIISEKEILETPNNYELGEKIRNRLFDYKNKEFNSSFDGEHLRLDIAPDGSVIKVLSPWICSVCGKETVDVDSDYLVGYDHLSCIISDNETNDKCVICGMESPYKKSTHIDHRVGYVDGAGQGCFQPSQCGK